MADEITIAELVRNGTMSTEIAALLWAAVDAQASFLTVAVPQAAGKTTVSHAALALRPPRVPLHRVAGEPHVMQALKQERRGGYLVVGEFSRAPVPGYIWGEPVRRVFDTLEAGYSLQTSLHAPGPEAAIEAVTFGNGIPDNQAGAIQLVVYIERFGTWRQDYWRRVSEVYEVQRVEGGRPVGQTLYRWQQDGDRFLKQADPSRLVTDPAGFEARCSVIDELVHSGRTSAAEVTAAVAAYRASAAVAT